MIYKSEDAFAKAYKEGTRYRAYLLYGSENYLIERWAAVLLKEGGDGGAFNLHRFDGHRPDMDDLFEAVEALPLMAEKKRVYLDGLDYAKLPGSDQKKLEEIVGDIPEGCVLIASAKAPGFDAKTASSKKLAALFDKAGCAVELGSRGQAGLLRFARDAAKKQGCTLSPEVGRYILRICDNEMSALSGELAKICAYAGQSEVTVAHVDAVAVMKTEARVFDLQKNILAGNAGGAMALLGDLFYLRESPVALLGVLSRAYVDLYRARVARENGVPAEEMIARFGYKGREFLVRGAFSGSANLTVGYLRRALDVLLDCDRALKSTGVDDRVLLEQAVVHLLSLDKRQV